MLYAVDSVLVVYSDLLRIKWHQLALDCGTSFIFSLSSYTLPRYQLAVSSVSMSGYANGRTLCFALLKPTLEDIHQASLNRNTKLLAFSCPSGNVHFSNMLSRPAAREERTRPPSPQAPPDHRSGRTEACRCVAQPLSQRSSTLHLRAHQTAHPTSPPSNRNVDSLEVVHLPLGICGPERASSPLFMNASVFY